MEAEDTLAFSVLENIRPIEWDIESKRNGIRAKVHAGGGRRDFSRKLGALRGN
jgi:hypothetical protein